MAAELCEYLVQRRDPPRHHRRDHTSIAQQQQEALQSRAVARADGLLPGSVTEIALNHSFVEVGQPGTAYCDPTQETTDDPEAPQGTLLSAPVFNETCRVALDELSVGSVLKAPEQPAPAQVLSCNHHLPPLLRAEVDGKLCRVDHLPLTVNPGEKGSAPHSLAGGIEVGTRSRQVWAREASASERSKSFWGAEPPQKLGWTERGRGGGHARVARIDCPDCGVRLVNVPWARPGSGFTLLFEAIVMTLVKDMPVAAAARLVGEHDTRLWRVIQ